MKKNILNLLQGAGFSCGALLVGIFFGLVLTPYMLETLGEIHYGIYIMASLFASWCGLLDLGLTITTSRYVTKYCTISDWKSVNEYGSTAIILFSGIAILVFVIACSAFGITILSGNSLHNPRLLATAFLCAGTSFAVSKISDGVCGILKGALRQDVTGGISLSFRLFWGIGSFIVLFSGGRLIELLIYNLSLTIFQLIIYILFLHLVVPNFHFSFNSFRIQCIKKLVNYGIFTFIAQIGEMMVNRSDLIIIATMMSIKDMTSYNLVVVTLVSYFNSFIYEASLWETNWFARLTTIDSRAQDIPLTERYKEITKSRDVITRTSIYISIFLASGVLVFAKPFISCWIGEEYLSAYPALVIYLFIQGLYRGSAETNARLLQGIARHQILAWGAVIHGITNIVLSVLLVKSGWGLCGVTLGTVIPGFIIYYLWIPKVISTLIGESLKFYWRRQIKATIISITTSLTLSSILLNWIHPSYLNLFLLACCFTIGYFIIIFCCGFSRQERRYALSLIQRNINKHTSK